ncbi:MAG: transcriptional regulator TbsP [Haloarculaceae archaeon]
MDENLHEATVSDVLRAVLSDATGDVFAVSPSAETIEDLVSVLGGLDGDASVRLLAPEDTLKHVMDDFVVAGSAADLIADGALELRTGEAGSGTLLVTGDAVVSVVEAGDRVAGLVTTDESFVGRATDRFDERWAAAPAYQLRTPPLSEVRATLERDIGAETASDFEAMLDALGTVRGDDELDEVTISLLVAAKNRELLYDISKWGEDVGIASKATFSRTKTKLEDVGVIDTEKVPIDVGRPRLRLLLGDDRLRDAEAADLATLARTMLDAA